MVKKVITNLDSPKMSGPDVFQCWFPGSVSLNFHKCQLNSPIGVWRNLVLQIVGRQHLWSLPVLRNNGKRSTATHYGLVCLLSVLSKIFEKLVNDRLIDHLKKYGLFSDFQHSFKSSWSTTDLLTVVSDRVAKAFNRSGLLQLWHLIHAKFWTVCSMLVFFTNSNLMEFQGQYLTLFHMQLWAVLDGKSLQEYPVNVGVPFLL